MVIEIPRASNLPYKLYIMKAFNVLRDNYRSATEGLGTVGKIIVTVVVAFIIVAIIFALTGVILDTI